jgi:hypothetical protein
VDKYRCRLGVRLKPNTTNQKEINMSNAIQNAAEDITLLATLHRIKRKADIMQMDAPRNSAAEHSAIELQLLVGIALRCIGEGKQ